MRGRTPITRQATLNGKHFRSTWPVFHFAVVFPHPARAAPGPPSPRGKATSGGGFLPAGEHSSGLSLNFRGSPPHPARAAPGPPSPSRRGRKAPCALRHRGKTILSSRNPGSFLPGWGAAASGWPCFRSGGSALSSRRRSGPPLPGCGSGRRTYRSASAARRLPAR